MNEYKFTVGTIEYKSDEKGNMIPDTKKDKSDVIVTASSLNDALLKSRIIYLSMFNTPSDCYIYYYVKSVEALNGI